MNKVVISDVRCRGCWDGLPCSTGKGLINRQLGTSHCGHAVVDSCDVEGNSDVSGMPEGKYTNMTAILVSKGGSSFFSILPRLGIFAARREPLRGQRLCGVPTEAEKGNRPKGFFTRTGAAVLLLLGAPGLTTRSKDALLGAPGITTSSILTTSNKRLLGLLAFKRGLTRSSQRS